MMSWLERAANLGRALKRRRTDDARMRLSRDELDAYRQAQLEDLVRDAAARSPFYRRLYGALPSRIVLADLPVVAKSALMSAYDDVVTDRRLTLARAQAHLATVRGDDRLDGDLRIMTSSGSAGAKAVFAYDRTAWQGFLTGSLRMTRLVGLAPRLGRRPRLATLAAPDGKHMSFRGGASMDVGLFASRRIPATLPMPALVAALNAHAPEFILGYPSVLALLAEEQQAGRLQIAPRAIVTSSEVRTPAMTAHIRGAWGVAPFDCLALTETGIAAVDCGAHAGLHVFEDLCILEVVDASNREVPFGTPGAKLLVTNLYNRTQPIIRFEVSDLVTMTDAPCPCGITFRRIVALDGRSDDLLQIGATRIHPIHLRGVLAGDPRVVQYQITQRPSRLEVQIVAHRAPAELPREIAARLADVLHGHGVTLPVEVTLVPAIAREEGAGKLKLVRRV